MPAFDRASSGGAGPYKGRLSYGLEDNNIILVKRTPQEEPALRVDRQWVSQN